MNLLTPMGFINVYSSNESAEFLYKLLSERTKEQSISHRGMPTFREHRKFVYSWPYPYWYIIEVDGKWIGATYLTKDKEIGIFILNEFQGRGYGKRAVKRMRDMFPGPMLANVNPENSISRTMFEELGGKLIQVTYSIGDD